MDCDSFFHARDFQASTIVIRVANIFDRHDLKTHFCPFESWRSSHQPSLAQPWMYSSIIMMRTSADNPMTTNYD